MSDHFSVTTAGDLLEQIRSGFRPPHEADYTHPYLDALDQKRVPQESLKLLATQQYLIVTDGIRNIALIVSRFGHLPSKKF